MSELKLSNLSVNIGEKRILTNITASIKSGDVVAIMGPNGHGKSTLLKSIMGHYDSKIVRGKIEFKNQVLNKLEVDERARLGLYLATQVPEEIPGVSLVEFIRSAINARREKPIDLPEFYKLVQTNTKKLKMNFELLNRSVNEGFSGGEKKKNEILLLKTINPDFAMLDEIDSGLDIDALKIITKELQEWVKDKTKALIIVSHYERMFKLVKPTKVFVVVNGTIITQGDASLAKRIDKEGYDWIKKEFKIDFKESKKQEFDLVDPFKQ
ncbi:Fe-S cluster assembly ATPase SufC [Mycoplasma sp. E35C]|uniref:Fe-S cluster assembly ATPase SufC n=1 Tax=Mycoplasma sp. E35C TaxID=2801918 RepID=UPI001CA4490D|nr:Fe-S cluster assembly ATPase SufC [Mycoplasma sp. E35C]QZX49366.1 Fe-S cluster assembly ATPase SufC [Mycoplasma sp. E35C]